MQQKLARPVSFAGDYRKLDPEIKPSGPSGKKVFFLPAF
jgi:hypothetical protein